MANDVVVSDELYDSLIPSKKGPFRNAEGKCYSPEEKIQACSHWMIGYSSRDIEKMLNIPSATVRKWMGMKWWKQLLVEIRKAKQDELDNELTRIIHKATRQLEDRIDNGNVKYNANSGETVRVPLTASELSVAGLAIPYDKRALGRGDPTSKVVREEVKPTEMLEQLAQAFVKMVKDNSPSVQIEAVEVAEFTVVKE